MPVQMVFYDAAFVTSASTPVLGISLVGARPHFHRLKECVQDLLCEVVESLSTFFLDVSVSYTTLMASNNLSMVLCLRP